MKTVKVFCVFLASATLGVMLTRAQTVPLASPANASQPSAGDNVQKLDSVRATLILRTSLTSKNAPQGKPVRADLEQALKLPDGEILPKGTTFLGTVLASSKHSKDKPNGTLVLEFHEAAVKGRDPVRLIVRLKGLAPSVENENARTTLPTHGNMVALAGNSGGSEQLNFEFNDRSNLTGKQADMSSVAGIHLLPSAQGAGAIFSLGEDVFLDADVQMTVLVAPVPH
jgi:hypothetical protein